MCCRRWRCRDNNVSCIVNYSAFLFVSSWIFSLCFRGLHPLDAPSREPCRMRASTAGRGRRPHVDSVTHQLTFCSAAPLFRAHPRLAKDPAGERRTNPWVTLARTLTVNSHLQQRWSCVYNDLFGSPNVTWPQETFRPPPAQNWSRRGRRSSSSCRKLPWCPCLTTGQMVPWTGLTWWMLPRPLRVRINGGVFFSFYNCKLCAVLWLHNCFLVNV